MGAFAAGIDLIFADLHIGKDALYREGGADPGRPVRVIWRAPDRVVNWGEGRFVTETLFLDVRVSEVPDLAAGDTFEINDEQFEVRSEPVRDSERLCWAAEVRPL